MPGINTFQKLGWSIRAKLGGGIGFNVATTAPVDGTSGSLGYACGALWLRIDPASSPTTCDLYMNRGTPTSPVWKKVAIPDSAGLTTITGSITLSSILTATGGVAAAGGYSAWPTCFHVGGIGAANSTDGVDTTPSATVELIGEVFVGCNSTATGVALMNGSVAATDKNIAILYDSTGAILANSDVAGITASGTDAYQRLVFGSPVALKGPASYFIGIQTNGTTTRINTHGIGSFRAGSRLSVFGTTAALDVATVFATQFTANKAPFAQLY